MMPAAGDIAANLERLNGRIVRACERGGRRPEDVTLVAVTKTVGIPEVRAAYACGIRNFGENRVQEAAVKIEGLAGLQPRPVWHMIGHLQSNKAGMAAGLFDIIQSVDSVRLAGVLSRKAAGPLPVLLEVNVAGESSKSGFAPVEVAPALAEIAALPDLEVKGLMTVAPLAADAGSVRPVFRQLRALRDDLGLEHLSMGMTDDFEVAIEEGATIIRVGRAIFGERKDI